MSLVSRIVSLIEGPAGYGARGSRGTPGYPVPPEMKAEPQAEAQEHDGFFIALQVPPDVASRLVLEGGEPVEKMHVTLVYTKSGDQTQRAEAAMIAGEMFEQVRPIEALLGGLGRFSASPTSDGDDVVYVSVDSPQLTKFRNCLVMRLAEIGIEADSTHGYSPHVTVKYMPTSEKLEFRRVKPINVSFDELVVKAGQVDESKAVNESGAGRLSADKAAKLAELVEASAEKLKARGIDVSGAKPLGVGSHGVAFQVGDKVLKLTDDEKEATASAWLKGKDLGNVVKIFDVFRFGKEKVFGIYQELLKSMPPADKNEFVEFVTDLEVESGLLSKLWERPWDEVVAHAMEGAKDDEEATPESIQRVRKELMVLQRKYQMDKITGQLAKQRVKFRDYHGGNIMLRGDQHVVIDLGYSNSPKAAIDVMERVMRSLVEAPPPIPADAKKKVDPATATTGKDAAKSEPEDNTAIQPKDAQELVKRMADKLRKRGIDITSARPLGTGQRGTALDVGSDKVLKVTSDKKEAVASNRLKQFQNLKHIARIFDVFRFPDTASYGIYQEKLTPLQGGEGNPDKVTGEAAELNAALIDLYFPMWVYKSGGDWDQAKKMTKEYVVGKKVKGLNAEEAKKALAKANESWKVLHKFQIPEMMADLKKAGITFQDYHAGNIMKRGADYVLIDIGLSKVEGGKEPDVLERMNRIKEMTVSGPTDLAPVDGRTETEKFGSVKEEKKADSVALIKGTFQPFHKGHAKVVRDLSKKFTKVVIFVDDSGPISFDTTWETIKQSLPDVEPKLEVYKSTGDSIVDSLSDVIKNHNSSVEHDTAVNLFVSDDKVDQTKSELSSSDDVHLDPTIVAVGKMPASSGPSDEEALKAVSSGDEQAAGNVFDAHLVSNKVQLKNVMKKISDEAGQKNEDFGPPGGETTTKKGGNYSLQDVGGEAGMTDILNKNAAKLKEKKNIDVANARPIGHGQMGVAYSISGGSKVLKLTTDDLEAKTSNYLKGKTPDHVVHIDDVYRFPVTNDAGVPVYGIQQEHLKELEPQEKKDFDGIAHYLRDSQIINITATGDFAQILSAIKRTIEADSRKEMDLPAVQPDQGGNISTTNKRELKSKSISDKRFADIQQGLLKFNVDKMVTELRSLNIHFADYHSGNVMKRGNTYVINDIGKSKSPGVEPDMLERVIEGVWSDFSGPGSSQVGTKAGSSGFSSSRNCVDGEADGVEEPATWADKIQDPQLKQRGGSVDDVILSYFGSRKGK